MTHLGRTAQATPDKAAYIMAGSGQVVTFKELDDESNRLAQAFYAAGLRPGDHIAFCMENHPRFLHVAWAAQRSGLLYTAISSRLGASEIDYIINDCGAQAFVASEYVKEAVAGSVDSTPNVKMRLAVGGPIDGFDDYDTVVAAYDPVPLESEVEGADMLYSSGTTGRPKGVKPHVEFKEFGSDPALLLLVQLLFGVDEKTIYLSPAPLYHAAPLRFTMGVIRAGATAIIMERFDPEDALRQIAEHSVTHSQWVPTMFIRMLKLPESVRAAYDVSSLEYAIHAAAPIPVATKREMIEWWGPVLHEYYAGTEGNGFVYCNSEQWLEHPGTVGMPIQCELHICDENGDEVPVGEEGTVFFAGGATFEYHNDSEKTSGSRHPTNAGWSTLGDVGRLDEDGFLYLTDRKAFMIISGGVNIYPQEIENLLIVHPDVGDVAVFGVPNEDFGEEVKAVVEPADTSIVGNEDAEAELERILMAICREGLSSVKCPRSIDFRETLPRHPTGKLYKRLLKDEYWEAAGRRI